MTTAKLLTTPGEGHGLTEALNTPIYRMLTSGEDPKPIVAVVVLKPSGWGGSQTQKGRHQHVAYEVSKLEPVRDGDQANELRYLLQALYEARTSTGDQRMLPIALGKEDEKRLALMERIEEWSTARGQTAAELESLWRENFGAGTDDDWSFGDQGVPGDYRKATSAHLLSFAYTQGVLSTDSPLPHEDREDVEDVEDEDDAGGVGSGETATAAAGVGVTCQVCGQKSDALSDGLCRDCAKNAGVPHLGDDAEQAETA